MAKYQPGDRVWIVPCRPPDGALSTGVVVPLPPGFHRHLVHPADTLIAPAVFAVRLDNYDGDPRFFPETDLRPVTRS
jgi:hypothetical protein